MRYAVFKVMLLSLLRDRGALAMSFVLPGLVFAIFAVALAAASGGQMEIRISVADQRSDELSLRVIEELKSSSAMRLTLKADRDRIVRAVRSGTADVGLIIRKRPPGAGAAAQPQPMFEIVTDPAREIATTMLQANLQRAALALNRTAVPQNAKLFERTTATQSAAAFTAAAYYSGAVAIMFMLYSALTAAASYLDERERGLLDRISAGPGGAGVVIDGKFLFIVVLGFLEATLVFLVAWLGFGVDLPAHVGLWAATTLMASIASAGVMLAFVTLLTTKRQAETLGQMVAVVMSAIGGSMVPRFIMPEYVQAAGWVTPNAWALEAYAAIFWLGGDLESLQMPWLVLSAMGLSGLLFARIIATRRRLR